MTPEKPDPARAVPAGLRPEGAVLPAVAYKIASTGLFTVMGALIKSLGDAYPTNQIVFVRSLFALIPVLIMVQAAGGWRVLITAYPWSHLGRSLAGLTAMTCLFAALALIPLATATAIAYAAPLFTTALAALLLGERVRRYRWAAVVVGFFGVLVMLAPAGLTLADTGLAGGGDRYALGAGLALAGAIFMALAMVQIRRLTGFEPSIRIVFYFTAIGTVAAGLTLPVNAVLPTWPDAAVMLAIGVTGGLAQLTLTASYRGAPASVIAPFDYTSMLWALVLGYVLFAEVPQPLVLIGAGVVIAAGLFILYHERRTNGDADGAGARPGAPL
jgi:drug/metabolite transporter (DMT)-like permease